MTFQGMVSQMLDGRELNYQIALDLVEAEEASARRQGVPTVADTMAAPASRRISAHDPDWFQRLERLSSR